MHMTAASSAHTDSETACRHTHTVTCMSCVLSHDAAMLIRLCQLVDSTVASLSSLIFMPVHVYMSSTAFLSIGPTSVIQTHACKSNEES